MTVAPTEPSAGDGLDPDLAVGSMVGEYSVEGKLGQGGFGAVFKAVHPLIGKQVAIKVLSTRFSSDREMVSRFIAEAKAVNQIRHRNIIDIFSFGQLDDRRWYYVMEYIDGEPLDRRVDRAPMTLGEALPILRAVAKALDAAHAKGIAHRDLKAENIFLGTESDGSVFPKLLDFGIAKLMGTAGGVGHKTQTGAPMGTPYYMSPEQARGRDVDHRTDLYAFGVLVYVMLTQHHPIDGDDFMTILMRQVSDEPAPASSLVPELSAEVDDVIAWLMRKDPAERPPNLITAVKALEVAAGIASPISEPISVPRSTNLPTPVPRITGLESTVGPSSTAAPTLQPPARSKLPLVVGALVVAAAAVVAVVMLRGGGAAPAATPDAARVATPDAAAVIADAAVVVEADAAVPADVAPAPRFVTVTLDGAPAGAEVRVAGQLIGTAPRVQLPRGDAEIQLVVSADGYLPASIPFVPTADGKRTVKLKRRGGGGPIGGARPGSGSGEPTDEIIDFPKGPK